MHSSSFDFKKQLYEPLRKSKLNNLHKIKLPHETSTQQFDSKSYMDDCDLVIAEVTYPSTGQGIELGWADMKNVKIVCIYKKGSKLSSALKVVTNEFIEYKNSNDMVEKLVIYLEK